MIGVSIGNPRHGTATQIGPGSVAAAQPHVNYAVSAGEAVTGPPWSQLPECRYAVAHQVYNVADFGVPQQRHRVFIVGFRGDLRARWTFPEPTHSEDALLYAQHVDGSYWAEHGLPRRPIPPRLAGRLARLAAKPRPLTVRWRTVRDAISDRVLPTFDDLHSAFPERQHELLAVADGLATVGTRRHRADRVNAQNERKAIIECRQDPSDLPEPVNYARHAVYDNHVGIPDARSYIGHTGSPWDWPAKAIKAGDHGNPGGENMLRRDDGSVRYFTVRELARLQAFPDAWHFANSWTESRRQLGNAVPVTMAEILARRMYEALALADEQAVAPLAARELIPAD